MITENIPIKGVGYIRYSDKKQDDKHSIEIQKTSILMFAKRHNIEIVKWCIDKATSAFSKKIESREGIHQVLEELKNGAEAFCFYDESRLSRQISDFYFSVYVKIKTSFPHVKFYCSQIDGEWDANDPLVQTKFVFANEESETKSVRAKDTHRKILNSNEPFRPGSKTPLGYDMVEGVLVPNSDLNVVVLIYFLTIWGHSHRTIADFLNNANITTKKNSSWSSSTIGYILNNPAYEGVLKWHHEKLGPFTSPNSHKAIISSTMLYLSRQNAVLKKQYGKMDTPFYFRDLLECKNCCIPLIAKDNSPKGKSKQYLIYKCESCKESIAVEPINEAVFKELAESISKQKETLISNAYSQLYTWQLKLNELNEAVLKQLNEHHEKLERLRQSDNPNKEILIDAFNESILHFMAKQNEYLSLIQSINDMLEDHHFDQTLDMLLKNHIYTLSNTEKRIFSLSFIGNIQIDFQKDCALSIDFRLTPFVLLENLLVVKPN